MSQPFTSEEFKAAVLKALDSVVSDFQKARYTMLIEGDIQCRLYAEILRKIDFRTEKLPFHPFEDWKTPFGEEISLVYADYDPSRAHKRGRIPCSLRNSEKIDIVCLNPEALRSLHSSTETSLLAPPATPDDSHWLYSLPSLIGIEVRHAWHRSTIGCVEILGDISKLYSFSYLPFKIEICFVHDMSKFDAMCGEFSANGMTITPVAAASSFNCIYLIPPHAPESNCRFVELN